MISGRACGLANHRTDNHLSRAKRSAMYEMNKKYFCDLVDTVGAKLKELPVNCHIRKHFPDSRLDQISKKIEESHCKDLEWGYWQPFFLFLKTTHVAAIQALENDLQMVMERTSSRREAKLVEFLNDEQERGSSWSAGLFETFVKAAFLKNKGVSVSALDSDLPNQRNIDVKLQIGERKFCVECTTMGSSEADKTRWEKHCEKLKADPNACLCDSQDAYTQGRRLRSAGVKKRWGQRSAGSGLYCYTLPLS